MDIGNSVLLHKEFEREKSMANNGGPVCVILNRRSLGFTSVFNFMIYLQFLPYKGRKVKIIQGSCISGGPDIYKKGEKRDSMQ